VPTDGLHYILYFALLISFSGWLLGTMYMRYWEPWLELLGNFLSLSDNFFSCMSSNINDYVFTVWDKVILQGWSFLFRTSHHEDRIPGENSMASVLDKDGV